MAIKLGWFAVRSTKDLMPVLSAMRRRAKPDDIPDGVCVGPTGDGFQSVLLLGWQFHAAPSWAQAMSQELDCLAVSFFVFEGTWNYAIFTGGHEVAAMEVYSLRRPLLYGDVDRAAALFAVEPDLFRRYEAALQSAVVEDDEDDFDEDEEDDEDEPPPFPGDEFAPHDEWAHLDFARRLGGLEYPEGPGAVEVRWEDGVRDNGNTEWIGLPPRLPMPKGEPG